MKLYLQLPLQYNKRVIAIEPASLSYLGSIEGSTVDRKYPRLSFIPCEQGDVTAKVKIFNELSPAPPNGIEACATTFEGHYKKLGIQLYLLPLPNTSSDFYLISPWSYWIGDRSSKTPDTLYSILYDDKDRNMYKTNNGAIGAAMQKLQRLLEQEQHSAEQIKEHLDNVNKEEGRYIIQPYSLI